MLDVTRTFLQFSTGNETLRMLKSLIEYICDSAMSYRSCLPATNSISIKWSIRICISSELHCSARGCARTCKRRKGQSGAATKRNEKNKRKFIYWFFRVVYNFLKSFNKKTKNIFIFCEQFSFFFLPPLVHITHTVGWSVFYKCTYKL